MDYQSINMVNDASHDNRSRASSGITARPRTPRSFRDDADAPGDRFNTEIDMERIARSSARSFTPRSLIAGIVIGTLITFSNTYFGLQTGWISTMAMPSALIGFSVFKVLSPYLSYPFTPIENVLIQTVAGAVGTMPLGCGFVGVIPAMEFLLKKGPDGPAGGGDSGEGEGGPLRLGFWKLVIWSLGVCLFGVVFAVPLRKEVIVREKLKFPSGTASALMLRVLHRGGKTDETAKGRARYSVEDRQDEEEEMPVLPRESEEHGTLLQKDPNEESAGRRDWRSKMRLLVGAFTVSGVYTLFSYFVPQIREVPILGLVLANNWRWMLNPSPAYIGQGIIMGPSTCMHMLAGAVFGWGVLSPIAKSRGWATGPVGDWQTGSKGWIVWVSLAIMLADSVVSLGWLMVKPLITHAPRLKNHPLFSRVKSWASSSREHPNPVHRRSHISYSSLSPITEASTPVSHQSPPADETPVDEDAPPSQLISTRTVMILLPLTLVLNVICMHIVFGDIMSPLLSSMATLLAVLLSVMGVRAMGETDLNPVSGISKLTQVIFSLATPSSHFSRRTAIITNLLAGAVSEAGALQAGDMMQDLKTGHILGASPKAQYYGQMIGSLIGAVLSTAVYKMYVNVYEVPGPMFQTPTAYTWIMTARLVTGQGLPPMAWQASLLAGAVFIAITIIRIYAASPTANGGQHGASTPWRAWIPGGIAVAVGMFNEPSFTLARAIGGIIAWWWSRKQAKKMAGASTAQGLGVEHPPAHTAASSRAHDSSSSSRMLLEAERRGNPAQSHLAGHKAATDQEESDAASSTVVVLASGLILGEGIVSIVNLLLASGRVPHL